MATDVIGELQFLSDRLSDRVRTISWSVLGLVWLFLTGRDSSPVLPAAPNKSLLLFSGALALGALVLDYLQYVFGYLTANQTQEKAEQAGKKNAQFDRGALLYRMRLGSFWSKQIVMVLALGALSLAVLQALI